MIFVTVVVPVLGVLIIIAALIAFRIQAVRAAREEDHWIEDESRLAKLANHRIDDDDFVDDIADFTGEIPDDIPEFTPGHGAVAADPEWDAAELLSSSARTASPASPASPSSDRRTAGRARSVPLSAPVAATSEAPLDTEPAIPQPLETSSPGPVETTAAASSSSYSSSGSGSSGPVPATTAGSDTRTPHAPQSFGQYAAETPLHDDADDDTDDPWTRLSFSRPTWPSGSAPDGESRPDPGLGGPSGPAPLDGTTTSGRSVPAGSPNDLDARRLPTVAELVHQIQTERHAPLPQSPGGRRGGARDVPPSGATAPGRSWTQPQIRSRARQEEGPLLGGGTGPQRLPQSGPQPLPPHTGPQPLPPHTGPQPLPPHTGPQPLPPHTGPLPLPHSEPQRLAHPSGPQPLPHSETRAQHPSGPQPLPHSEPQRLPHSGPQPLPHSETRAHPSGPQPLPHSGPQPPPQPQPPLTASGPQPLPETLSGPQRPVRTDPLSGAGGLPSAPPSEGDSERPRRRAKHRRPEPIPTSEAGQDITSRTPPDVRSPKPSANRSDHLPGGAARPGGHPAYPPRDDRLADPSSRRPVRGRDGSRDGSMAPEPAVPAPRLPDEPAPGLFVEPTPRPPDEDASATGRLCRERISGLAPTPGVRVPGRETDGEPLTRHEEGFKHRDASRTGRPDHGDRPGDGVRRKPPVHRHPADGRWRP